MRLACLLAAVLEDHCTRGDEDRFDDHDAIRW